MSFVLKWVSFRQHIYGFFFIIIHLATPCLLIRAFDPFTFKAIIDRCLFIAIFLLHTCAPFSPSLFLHLLTAVPLAYLAVLVWWRYTLLAFFFVCLESSLFHLLF